MPDLTDTQAHTAVLHALINDMSHVLHWLTIGLFLAAAINGIHGLQALAARDWIFAGFDGLFTVAFAAWAWGTAKRERKYGRATR